MAENIRVCLSDFGGRPFDDIRRLMSEKHNMVQVVGVARGVTLSEYMSQSCHRFGLESCFARFAAVLIFAAHTVGMFEPSQSTAKLDTDKADDPRRTKHAGLIESCTQ